MAETKITIPLPTNQTSLGPRITHDKSRLIVEYDYEGNGDVSQWVEIFFTEPLFFQFADISCCQDTDVVSSNEIRRQDESELLASVLSQWNESVGWQEWQQQKGGSDRFDHFTIFFDDTGAINVIASECHVRCR